MNQKMLNKLLFVSYLLVNYNMHAMISDNRFFHATPRSFVQNCHNKSQYTLNSFLIVAHDAYGDIVNECIGIPEIYGLYDQKQLSVALEKVGKYNPLSVKWRNEREIRWDVRGAIVAEGGCFHFNQAINDTIYFGGSVAAMQVKSTQRFLITKKIERDLNLLSDSDKNLLDEQRRAMHDELGLGGNGWSESGISDIDLFICAKLCKDYVLKMRSLNVSVASGLLIPSGKKSNAMLPASISFGGDGMLGCYFSGDAVFELREDWTLGFKLQISQRMKKIIEKRIPVNEEHPLFAVVVGNVQINPGVSVLFSPYFTFGDLRDGFGIQARYSLFYHAHDVWEDMRVNQDMQAKFSNLYKNTRWSSEAVTVSLLYDWSKLNNFHESYYPIFSFSWDIPCKILQSLNSAKCHKITLSAQYNF